MGSFNELAPRSNLPGGIDPKHLSIYTSPDEAASDFTQIAAWLSQKNSRHTKRAYSKDVSMFLEFARLPLRQIRSEHIAAFLNLSSDKSPATKNRRRNSIGSLFTYLVKTRFLDFSPAAAIEAVNVPDKTANRSLPHELIMKATQFEPNPRNKVLIELLYVSGIRREECSTLKFSSFKQHEKSVQMIVVGKGGKVRSVHLPLRFWELIQSLKDSDLDGPVFVSRKQEGPLTPGSINMIVKTALTRVGAPSEASAHWLRHSHGTNARKRKQDLRKIQVTLGHASIRTTEKYTHVDSDESSALCFR